MSAPERPTGAGWLAGEGLRWAIVTLLIPFTGFVWNELQERQAARQAAVERVRAEEQARIADARSESDVIIRLLPALADPNTSSPTRGIALAVLLNLASRQALSPELVSAIQVAVDTTTQRVREGTATEAERLALGRLATASDRPEATLATGPGPAAAPPTPGNEPAPAEPDAPARPSPVGRTPRFELRVPRVYIHIFDERDRLDAERLLEWIVRDQRWLAPGIENVSSTAARTGRAVPRGTRTGSVRYFNEEDQSSAGLVAERLGASAGPAVVQFVKMSAPRGQLEVWFPAR